VEYTVSFCRSMTSQRMGLLSDVVIRSLYFKSCGASSLWRIQGESVYYAGMDEGRKRVIGIMAAILAARKLCQLDSTRSSPALHSIIADAVIFAERIMQKIDSEWPMPRQSSR
jgi:hypothetical protein